jgi:hypothetical protein
MRSCVGILAVITFVFPSSVYAAAQSADPARPNVVLIMTDDSSARQSATPTKR